MSKFLFVALALLLLEAAERSPWELERAVLLLAAIGIALGYAARLF